jgi:GcrA cell cycle regulator
MLNMPHPQREQQDLDRLRDKLAKGWSAGLSTRQIGEKLGLSRGAIIGLVNRARTHGDDRFRSRPAAPKPPRVRKLKPAGEAIGNRTPPEPPPAPSEPRLLIDLDWRDCRCPVGRDVDGRHLMCGRPQSPGRPYCERHCGAVRSEARK